MTTIGRPRSSADHRNSCHSSLSLSAHQRTERERKNACDRFAEWEHFSAGGGPAAASPSARR